MLAIRLARQDDAQGIADILLPMVHEGEAYALPMGWDRDEVLAYWTQPTHRVFVAEHDRVLVGTYYLRSNQLGGGDHVANCGYVTALDARRLGIARRMAFHSLEEARASSFRAMQFNFVITTNDAAIALWTSLSFKIVGTIPEAFCHPRFGYVDVLVMHRNL